LIEIKFYSEKLKHRFWVTLWGT